MVLVSIKEATLRRLHCSFHFSCLALQEKPFPKATERSTGESYNFVYKIDQKFWKKKKSTHFCFTLHRDIPKEIITSHLGKIFTGLLSSSNFFFNSFLTIIFIYGKTK